jgi:hypothetical protein
MRSASFSAKRGRSFSAETMRAKGSPKKGVFCLLDLAGESPRGRIGHKISLARAVGNR